MLDKKLKRVPAQQTLPNMQKFSDQDAVNRVGPYHVNSVTCFTLSSSLTTNSAIKNSVKEP